jgi:hypothetical protein
MTKKIVALSERLSEINCCKGMEYPQSATRLSAIHRYNKTDLIKSSLTHDNWLLLDYSLTL